MAEAVPDHSPSLRIDIFNNFKIRKSQRKPSEIQSFHVFLEKCLSRLEGASIHIWSYIVPMTRRAFSRKALE